jgi:ABC-type sugar transport system substrate-binding protein
MRITKSIRWTLIAAALIVAAIAVAGCGGSDSSSSTGSSEGGTAGTDKQQMEQAGTKAAEEAGPAVKLPTRKVGVLLTSSNFEALKRQAVGVEEAAGQLGWTVETCDAQGVPQQIVACATTLLTKGSNVIVSTSDEAGPLTVQMKQAQAEGIPWINTGGAARESPLFTSQANENEKEMTDLLVNYMLEKLGSGEHSLAYSAFPPIYALALREAALKEALESEPNVKVVSSHVENIADPVNDIRSWATATLASNPELSVFFPTLDTDVASIATVLSAKYPGKEFPERPLLVGYYGDLVNLEAMRKGQVDALAEAPLEAAGWMALDQAASSITEKPVERDATKAYPVNFLAAQLITKEDVPADSQTYIKSAHDYASFFEAKWGKEFETK